MKRVSVAVVIMIWILHGSRCFAALRCPPGSHYVTHTNFEYCVTTDAEGKDWFHGPFVRYFDYNRKDDRGNSVFPNDKKQEVGNYNMGKREGMWTTYHKDGMKLSETPYVRGEANGISKTWDVNGMLRKKIEYKDGKPLHYGMTPKQEAAGRAAASSPKVQRNVQRINRYSEAHPLPVDPCEGALRRYSEWMKVNVGRADYEQYYQEAKTQMKVLKECENTPEYQQYQKEKDANATAFSEQLKRWSGN